MKKQLNKGKLTVKKPIGAFQCEAGCWKCEKPAGGFQMGKRKAVKTGKKPHRNKPTSKKYLKYKIEGGKITRERF